MQDALFSPHWYRISGLHPRLRPHVSVRMQTTRGQAWYVLFNQATGRHHRVNAHAYQLVGRLDGRLTVEEIWQHLLRLQGDTAPSQHDVIRILGQMTDAGLIQAEVTPDVRQQLQVDDERQRRLKRAKLNPLSFRMGLFNPSMWLERVTWLSRWMWSRWAQVLWLVVVLGAAWALLSDLRAVLTYARIHFFSPSYLALAWLAYPCMKALHELGHALTLRRFGCDVPEVGVNFFLFVPLPYVDASAANRLSSRWQRARISAAGIIVELFLAALGGWVWLTVEEGWLRQGAFVVLSLGTLSSFLFNGNPLMKLDGYYMMCDALDLPNLSTRSSQLLSHRWRRLALWCLRLEAPADSKPPVASDGLERVALWLYAPLAWCYRCLISVMIVGWAAAKASVLGLLVAAWSFWTLVIVPLSALVDSVRQLPAYVAARGRITVMVVLASGVGLAAIMALPIPSSLVIDGVVWLPDDAKVRAAIDGRVETVWVRPDQPVRKGDALITLSSDTLATQRDAMLMQIERSDAEFNAAFGVEPLKMKNAQEAAARDREALARIERDMASLVVRAPRDGVFSLSRGADLEGREVNQGDLLAYVMSPGHAVVRAVVPQSDVEEVRARLRRVEVVLAEQPGRTLAARMYREVPSTHEQLPSAALADRMGGPVPTDPKDPDGLRPLLPAHVVDIDLSESLPRTGGLAQVRLELKPESLMTSAVRRVRQLLLRHFSDVQA